MMRRFFFFNLPNPSGRTRPWGLPSLQQKWIPEAERCMFLGSKVQPVSKADNFIAFSEPIVWQCGIRNISQPYRLPRPFIGIALLKRKKKERPPPRSSGQNSKGPGFDFRHYHILWEVVGMERGPLSLVSATEELLGRNCSGFGLEIRECGHGDPLRWKRDTLHPQKWAITSLTSGRRSVGIVCSQTKAKVFSFFMWPGNILLWRLTSSAM
jgi:hypothetical protein